MKKVNKNEKIKKEENNKKKIIIAASIIIGILLIGVISIIINNQKNKDLDNVVLETHANDIYEWEYEIENESIVEFYKKQKSGDLKGTTQEGIITESYMFKAKKPGKTNIKFTFINKNNGSYGEIKHYKAVVDKDNRLIIKETKTS